MDMEQFDNYCYHKKDLIGHGAFAVVYRGRHKENGTEVAIKAIAKKNLQKAKNLLTKEIKILQELKGLQHENLVSLLRCVESLSHVFLVMEFCNSGDLADYLVSKGTINELTIQHFFNQIARALKALHQKEIVHRDLKPQNILLCNPAYPSAPNPTQLIVKLADFGFARFLSDGVMAGTLCGSPMYMAPEVIMSMQYGAKADLWSVGTIMFQCLTGKAPFMAQTPQALKGYYERHERLTPQIPEYCSPTLADLLYGLLKRNPAERMEFHVFFNHPFFTAPLPASPSRRILGQSNPNHYGNIYGGHNRPPISTAPGVHKPHYGGGGHADLQHHQHNFGLPSPSAPKILPLGAQHKHMQQPSREIANKNSKLHALPAPQVNAHGRHQVGATAPSRAGVMSDSSDFIFLPALTANDPYQITAPDQQGNRNYSTKGPNYQTQKLQLSNTSSNGGGETPVKQVQVRSSRTSSTTNVKAVPVPSQRQAYAKMEERQNAGKISSQTSTNFLANNAPISLRSTFTKEILRIPSVEEIQLPETHYVIRDQPKGLNSARSSSRLSSSRRNNVRELSDVERPSSSLSTTAASLNDGTNQQLVDKGVSKIPKSATCGVPLSSAAAKKDATNSADKNILPTELDNIRYLTSNSNADQMHSFSTQVKIVNNNGGGGAEGSNNDLPDECESDEEGNEDDIYLEPDLPFASEEDVMENSSMDCTSNNNPVQPFNRSNDHQPYSCGSSNEIRPIGTAGQNNLPPKKDNFSATPKYLFDAEPPSELEQETMLPSDHRQVLAKLRFVLELIEAIVSVAENKSNPIAQVMIGGSSTKRKSTQSSTEAYRRAEQLVLYVRALHIISSALVMAQRQIGSDCLQPSQAVQSVLNSLNEKYHNCLSRSQELASLGVPGTDTTTTIVSAERIMYQHAIDLCQSAALDELFGNPHLCPKRYHTAYMMLHTLLYTVQDEHDKTILLKYKDSVEKRLKVLERQGLVTSVVNSL